MMNPAAIFLLLSTVLVVLMMIGFLWRYAPERQDKILGVSAVILCFLVPGVLSASGFLSDFSSFPPALQKLMMVLFVLSIIAPASAWGRRVSAAAPFVVLVGLQTFRFLPEAFLVLAYNEGIAPIQMTLHGRNLDIITAIFSLILLLIWRFLKNPRPWIILHSIVGLSLLINVVGTAILSMPTPFRVFLDEPSTAFVGTFPYTWLPSVHVVTALILHGLTVRKLFSNS